MTDIEKNKGGQKESRHPLQRISSKLVIAVLVAVLLPFFGLVYFIDSQIDTRLKENIVRRSLLSLATDLANEVNAMMRKRNSDLLLMTTDILGDRSVLEYIREMEEFKTQEPKEKFQPAWGPDAILAWAQDPESDERWSWKTFWRRTQTDIFNQYVRFREAYDLLLLVGPEGQPVACSSIKPDGSSLDRDTLAKLFSRNYSNEPWFRESMAGKMARVDHHMTDLLPKNSHGGEDPAGNYYIGFAGPVKCYTFNRDHIGVIYVLVNWKHIQQLMDVPRIKAYFSGLVKDKEPSPYAWIWGADAETILAHQDRSLYGEKIGGPRVNLPQMVADARSSRSGLYREYEFRGQRKNAAYQHCNGPNRGPLDSGFGWVVGVGIDNDDIYAMAGELKRLLYTSTALVSLLVILWIMMVARRTAKPILALQKHIRKVSNGNLEPHTHVGTGDEISDLADDFNRMILELKEKREQLIKVEKNAAWREMARQISHDIKNALTPIKLSVDLLKQSCDDRSPNYQQILRQTLQLIDGQITNLQKIAVDFHEFTGGRRSILEKCDLEAVMSEVLDLDSAWAKELGIRIQVETVNAAESTPGKPGDNKINVYADCMKLHRVLTNIVANAFQAMPGGGTLTVSIYKQDNMAILEIRDTGVGIPDDVRAHLFEPYFTTRSKGTGLGLAIAKRVLEEIDGTIALEPNERSGGAGTVAVIRLPVS
ncbi:MAG: ATP-binding protein [Candidatus Aminicenantes bacterium]|nr:ATP-binding protein [Candidatus Aminicenantes bacterium]